MIIPPPVREYTEDFLKSRFANKYLGDQRTLRIGNIISFMSPININDIDEQHKPIKLEARQVINFCIEIPEISNYAGACVQKLFITNTANVIANNYFKDERFEVKNNDIIIHKEHNNGGIQQVNGVISVNQIKNVNGAILIYLGIYNQLSSTAFTNPRAFPLQLDETTVGNLMDKVNESFYHLVNAIFLKTAKM